MVKKMAKNGQFGFPTTLSGHFPVRGFFEYLRIPSEKMAGANSASTRGETNFTTGKLGKYKSRSGSQRGQLPGVGGGEEAQLISTAIHRLPINFPVKSYRGHAYECDLIALIANVKCQVIDSLHLHGLRNVQHQLLGRELGEDDGQLEVLEPMHHDGVRSGLGTKPRSDEECHGVGKCHGSTSRWPAKNWRNVEIDDEAPNTLQWRRSR